MDAPPLSPVERHFGPLLPHRECGGCTVCCTVPAISELAKPADTTCVHCVTEGCSIYQQRPSACRTFFCAWRRLEMLPDDLRPDRCGVVLMLEVDPDALNPFERSCVVARWLDDAPALEGSVHDRLRQLFRKGLVPLFFSPHRSSRKSLVHPSPEIYHAIMSGDRPTGKLKERTQRWRSALKRSFILRA